MKTTYTVCGICEQSCGLKVSSQNNQIIKVEPDKDNPYSWRDFCIKAGKSHLSLTDPKRITKPMKRVGDRYVEASYEEAIADISARMKSLIKQHGANAIGSYTGNPNGFNFGSALFHGLFLDAIGTQSRFWVGSVDTNAFHVVSENLYGNAWVSLQPDIDHCDHFLLIGANPPVSGMCWVGYSPDGWKRMLARQEAGATITVVDPRRTESASKASQHIAPLPESDWALLLAMIKLIFENQWDNSARYHNINDLNKIRDLASQADLEKLSQCCDVPVETIRQLAESFAKAPNALAIGRTGVSLGGNGTLSLWLIQVLNLITNRIEAEGGLYYAEGVLDVLKAGEQLFPPSDAVSRVRGNLNIGGAHSLAELPDEITTPGEGQVRAMIMNSGNPVISGPDGAALDKALAQLELFVVVDQFQRESHRHAHWLIPGDHFLERNDINPLLQALSPTPRAQMTRAAVELPEGMRFEWEFYRDLAMAMDIPLLMGKKWLNPIIRTSIRIANWTGNKHHGFSPLWLARMLIKMGGKFKWKDINQAQHGLGSLSARPAFGALFDKLATANGKVNIAPEVFLSALKTQLAEAETAANSDQFPLQLIGRRRMKMMNSWLSETAMTSMSEREISGDCIEVNRHDASTLGIADGQLVAVNSASGSLQAKARLSDDIRPGVVVMEHGWGSRTFDPKTGDAQSPGGVNRNALVSNTDLDPLSRVPRLNGTRVNLVATGS